MKILWVYSIFLVVFLMLTVKTFQKNSVSEAEASTLLEYKNKFGELKT